jgi:hypothetical protein
MVEQTFQRLPGIASVITEYRTEHQAADRPHTPVLAPRLQRREELSPKLCDACASGLHLSEKFNDEYIAFRKFIPEDS